MKPRPDNPFLGDIHLLADYPDGTPWSEITEFEIWNDVRWVPSTEAPEQVFSIESGAREKP